VQQHGARFGEVTSAPALTMGGTGGPGTMVTVSMTAAELCSPSLTRSENDRVAATLGAMKLLRPEVPGVSETATPLTCVQV